MRSLVTIRDRTFIRSRRLLSPTAFPGQLGPQRTAETAFPSARGLGSAPSSAPFHVPSNARSRRARPCRDQSSVTRSDAHVRNTRTPHADCPSGKRKWEFSRPVVTERTVPSPDRGTRATRSKWPCALTPGRASGMPGSRPFYREDTQACPDISRRAVTRLPLRSMHSLPCVRVQPIRVLAAPFGCALNSGRSPTL